MSICSCTTFGGNTGLPNCVELIGASRQFIIAPKFKTDGSRFSFPAGTTIDDAYLSDSINAEESQNRIYPIKGDLKNVTDERADPTTEDFDDGTSSIVSKGVRSVDAFIIDSPVPKLIENLEGFGCADFGIYIIDVNGNLVGSASKDCSELYPILVEASTWNPEYVKATSTTVAKIRLRFQWSALALDSDLNMFAGTDITADLTALEGLLDVKVTEVVAPSTTEFTVDMNYIYGNLSSGKQTYKGLSAGDAVVRNLTQGDTVTLDSVTETEDGRYVFDYTNDTQTLGDILQIESGATGNVLLTTGHEIDPTSLTAIA